MTDPADEPPPRRNDPNGPGGPDGGPVACAAADTGGSGRAGDSTRTPPIGRRSTLPTCGATPMNLILLVAIVVVALVVLVVALRSFHSIGPSEVGLVSKRVGRKLGEDELIALNGEAGYQADLLMPGLRFKLWPINKVEPLPVGAGAARPHRRRHGPRSATPCPPAPSRRSTSPSSATSPTSAASSATAASAACSARCCLRARPPRSTPSASSWPPSATIFGKVVSEAAAESIAQVDPNALKVVQHHPGRATATSSAWSPRWRARRRATSPAASAASATSAAMEQTDHVVGAR